MFWSKIWFFLTCIAAVAALTVALVLPKPAERAAAQEARDRLQRACSFTEILLRRNASMRVQLAGEFARADAPANAPGLRLAQVLYAASKGGIVSQDSNSTAKKALNELLDSVSGTKPDFVILLDRKGRVVAQQGTSGSGYGQSMKGYFLVDDALDGYMRDDLWRMEGTLYRVAASPVVTRQLDWAGAVVLGQAVDKEFAETISKQLHTNVTFYVADKAVASSETAQMHAEVIKHYDELKEIKEGMDCLETKPFGVAVGNKNYNVMLNRLPGEAGSMRGFYAVFAEQPAALGFNGTLDAVRKDDLSMANFPWIMIAIGFVLMVGLGFFFMIMETDRPLKRLNSQAVALAKGEAERVNEETHRGKFGSIARSINITIDKLAKDAKQSQKDLDQLLGPVPSSSPNEIPDFGPLGGSSASAAPPPPSEFKFGGGPRADSGFDLDLPPPPSSMSAIPNPPEPPAVKQPPPSDAPVAPPEVALPLGAEKTPPPVPKKPTPAEKAERKLPDPLAPSGDFDAPTRIADPLDKRSADDEAGFHDVFEQFVELKMECGENTDTITFEKFAKKLRANRDNLMRKHSCDSVKFSVYKKDGKAALKASPVKKA